MECKEKKGCINRKDRWEYQVWWKRRNRLESSRRGGDKQWVEEVGGKSGERGERGSNVAQGDQGEKQSREG